VTNSIIWTTEGRDGDPALRHGQLLGMVDLPHAGLTRNDGGKSVTQARIPAASSSSRRSVIKLVVRLEPVDERHDEPDVAYPGPESKVRSP